MPDIDVLPLPESFASDIARWGLEDRGDEVEVVPSLSIGYLLGVWAVGAILYISAMLIFPRIGNVPDPLWYGFFVGIPLFIVVANVLAYSVYRQGVRFLIDRANSTFTLPNVQKTWPLGNVLGWQVVNYNRGVGRSEYYRSQLIIVVREGSTIAHYLVYTGVGHGMASRFRELVAQVAAITPLRLVSYVDDGVDEAAAGA